MNDQVVQIYRIRIAQKDKDGEWEEVVTLAERPANGRAIRLITLDGQVAGNRGKLVGERYFCGRDFSVFDHDLLQAWCYPYRMVRIARTPSQAKAIEAGKLLPFARSVLLKLSSGQLDLEAAFGVTYVTYSASGAPRDGRAGASSER